MYCTTLRTQLVLLAHVLFLPFMPVHGAEPATQPVGSHPGVIFVLDGSGRLRLMAEDLARTVTEAGLPLEVREFNWSHGYLRIFCDLRNTSNHRAQGQALAEDILAYRSTCPGNRVFVVTHSAGAAVALAAAEWLPEGAIDRLIMLAPAVSPGCDVHPALRCCRDGVDVFASRVDLISRGLALTGCADGWHGYSAGAYGFKLPEECCPNLRQHNYTRDMNRCGHHGGHYGWTKIGCLREHVVVLFSEGH